eukprot:7151128-Pyramimonas_sp.AAC.1
MVCTRKQHGHTTMMLICWAVRESTEQTPISSLGVSDHIIGVPTVLHSVMAKRARRQWKYYWSG